MAYFRLRFPAVNGTYPRTRRLGAHHMGDVAVSGHHFRSVPRANRIREYDHERSHVAAFRVRRRYST